MAAVVRSLGPPEIHVHRRRRERLEAVDTTATPRIESLATRGPARAKSTHLRRRGHEDTHQKGNIAVTPGNERSIPNPKIRRPPVGDTTPAPNHQVIAKRAVAAAAVQRRSLLQKRRSPSRVRN